MAILLMLKDPSYCYKFYWLEAIVNLISEGVMETTFNDIIDEMICNAWYTQLLIELQLRLLICQIETGFSFGHAVGVQLDFLGESVSIPRREGWDDETYRSVLLRRLKLWTWDGTNETCRLFFLMGKTCRITTTVRLQLYAGKTPVLHEPERYRCRKAELIRKRCQVLNGSHALCSGCKYYQERGWADYEDRANLENVWQQYHALGAMGT